MDVYGLSLDSVKDQAQFVEMQELNFQLLSDPDGSAARKYGVYAGRFAQRVTFVIDAKGTLRKIDSSVQVNSHGEDLVEMVYELQSQ